MDKSFREDRDDAQGLRHQDRKARARGKPGSDCPTDRGIHGAFEHRSSGCIAPALATPPDQAKSLSHFSHGNSFSRSLGILPSFNEIEEGMIPRGSYPATTLSMCPGRFHRNVGRFPVGMLAVFVRNTQASIMTDHCMLKWAR